MSVPQMDAVDYQRKFDERCEKEEDDHRLEIALGARSQLDKASVIKYDNGLAYHTANKTFFRQANAICESALERTPSSSDSEKLAQHPESRASKSARQLGNTAGKRSEDAASKEPEQPASETGEIVQKLSNKLSTHALLVTRLDGALDRLETLAGANHRGYAAMRAWTYHFDAVAELIDAVAKMEKGILEEEDIKAFVAGENGRAKITRV